jgi:hypothetical protein
MSTAAIARGHCLAPSASNAPVEGRPLPPRPADGAADPRAGGPRRARLERRDAPLIYVLKGAYPLHDGDRLGPVGGRIVGEVLVGKRV